MMSASPNDVAFGRDACLRAHRGKHRIIARVASNIILSVSEKHHIEQGEIHHFTNSAAFFGNRKRFLRRSRRKITGRSCKKRHPTSGGGLLFCLDNILLHQVVGHGAEEFDDLGDIAFIEIIGAAVGNACDGTAHTDEGCFAAVALDAV